MEDNALESIQSPNTFRPRHQRERRTHLKQRHYNQNTTKQKAKSSFPKIGRTAAIQKKKITRTFMQRHTMTEIVIHSRNIILERSVKFYWLGGGSGRGWGWGGGGGEEALFDFYVATILALSSPPVEYTRQLFSPREGFSNSSVQHHRERKIKRIQRFNLYHSLGIFSRRQNDVIFLIFPRKQDLTFHANCLLRRQFAWNVKSCFLGKIRKIFQNVVCWKFYPEC